MHVFQHPLRPNRQIECVEKLKTPAQNFFIAPVHLSPPLGDEFDSLALGSNPDAVRFDMFGGEFTHVGDDCTFETLMKHFKLRDKRLEEIAQIIHDGDLEDNKFGRPEGKAIELITKGWGKMNWNDEEILRKGFELFDALYLTVGT